MKLNVVAERLVERGRAGAPAPGTAHTEPHDGRQYHPRRGLPRLRQHRDLAVRPGERAQLVPARQGRRALDPTRSELERATVDVGAIIDFASSFGTLVLTRAYADWSADVNAGYRGQLVGRAVDLVQLFPAAAYGKNGADIRLAVDAVEDMFRLPDLTHVVIVAGDSDYIALAQRCKRLGRYVVGIGVAGSSSRSLAAACDEFVIYDALPGVPVFEPPSPPPETRSGSRRPKKRRAASAGAQHGRSHDEEPEQPDPQAAATGAAQARPADRSGEGRRRLAAQLRGQGPDEADGPVVQREVAGLPVFQRLPALAVRRRRAGREFDDADGAVEVTGHDVETRMTTLSPCRSAAVANAFGASVSG